MTDKNNGFYLEEGDNIEAGASADSDLVITINYIETIKYLHTSILGTHKKRKTSIIFSRTSLGTKVHPKHADMLTSIVVDGVIAVR